MNRNSFSNIVLVVILFVSSFGPPGLIGYRHTFWPSVSAQVVTQRPTVKVFIMRDVNTYIIGDPCSTTDCLHIRSIDTTQPVRSFNAHTNNLAESLRVGSGGWILSKSRNKFKNIYGFTDAQIDANSYRLHLKMTQVDVDLIRQEISTFEAKVFEYSQNKIDPNIQIIEIANGADVDFGLFEGSPHVFSFWQGPGEVHEAILSSYARSDDFIFVVAGVMDPDRRAYYDVGLCDSSLGNTWNYRIPYTWAPLGASAVGSAIGCANHLTWAHGFVHQLADIVNKINPPPSPFIPYGTNNYEYFGLRLSCATVFPNGVYSYFPDADVAPLDPDFASCQGGFGENWIEGYCASLVAQGFDSQECNRRWDRHELGDHLPPNYVIVGNGCRNGRQDFDETGVDTGGQCSVYSGGGQVNRAPVVNAGIDQIITLPGSASLIGTITDDGLPSPPTLILSLWSKVSGPGTVTFADATARSAITNFSQAGTYTLRLTASDGSLWGADDVIITVNASPPDTIPPSIPTGLAATAVSSSRINLSWIASTDNVSVSGYRIYRSGLLITAVMGTSYQDIGLAPGTSYSYTVAAYDAAGNTSSQSSPATAATFSDTIPPAQVTNLTPTQVYSNAIALSWTAVGDDGLAGTAAFYDLRYSTSMLSESNWASTQQAAGELAPKPSGSPESYNLTGLSRSTTYYVGLKVRDEVENTSSLSNVVRFITKKRKPTLTVVSARGARHLEVLTLQQFLIDQGFLDPPYSTGYYGALTLQAVQQFQCRYLIICNGSPSLTGWGMVGPKTRAKINELIEAIERLVP